MLTSIRKVQKEVLIVVTFVVCVAFAVLYSKYDAGLASRTGPGEAVTVWGRSYRGPEALKIANQFNLAMSELGFRPPYMVTPIGAFAQNLHFMGRSEFNQDRTNYVVNLLVLRGAAERLGIEPSPEQVQKALEEVEAFRDPASGKFSEALMDRFVNERMGRSSMGDAELREMIGDYVAYDKLRELTSSGIAPTSWDVDREYRRRYEELTVYEVFIKRDAAQVPTVTDEEIKKYFDDNHEKLRTLEKKKIGYFMFPLPERKEGEAEDQWKAKRIEKARDFNKVYKELGEALERGESVDNALKLVKGVPAKEAGPFAESTPPEELKGEDGLLRRVFDPGVQAASGLGAAETQKAIYLFWVKQTVPSAEMTLDQAKEEIRSRLLAQKKDQSGNEQAEKARAALVAELKKGGRTFPDAAKAAGLSTKRLKPFNRSSTPEDSGYASTVASTVAEMSPGQLSDVKALGDGCLLVYLAQAQLPKRDSEPEDRKRIGDNLLAQLSNQAFMAWFEQERKLANPVLPTVKLRNGEVETLSIERFNHQ